MKCWYCVGTSKKRREAWREKVFGESSVGGGKRKASLFASKCDTKCCRSSHVPSVVQHLPTVTSSNVLASPARVVPRLRRYLGIVRPVCHEIRALRVVRPETSLTTGPSARGASDKSQSRPRPSLTQCDSRLRLRCASSRQPSRTCDGEMNSSWMRCATMVQVCQLHCVFLTSHLSSSNLSRAHKSWSHQLVRCPKLEVASHRLFPRHNLIPIIYGGDRDRKRPCYACLCNQPSGFPSSRL